MVSQKQLPHYDMQTQGGSDNTAAISSDMFIIIYRQAQKKERQLEKEQQQ